MSRAAASQFSRLRDATKTSAPASASPSAIARPRPRPPPVTSAQRPERSKSCWTRTGPPVLARGPRLARSRHRVRVAGGLDQLEPYAVGIEHHDRARGGAGQGEARVAQDAAAGGFDARADRVEIGDA